jgi:hypothetical protein
MSGRRRGAVCLTFVLQAALRTAAAEDLPSPTSRSFWIEASGGWAALRPIDLNARAEYGAAAQRHLFDAQLEALEKSRTILSWNKTESGARPRIDRGWNAGLRATYRINRALALSLGYQRVSSQSSADRSARYRRAGYYDADIEAITAAPDAVSLAAHAAVVGIELRHPLGGQLDAAAFLRAGPIFASFEYQTQWSYAWSKQVFSQFDGPPQTYPVLTLAGQSQEKGHGLGVALDAGLRLQRALGGRLAFFVEGAYAYQKVSSPAGSGSEERGGRRTTWEGDWIVQRERIAAPWGTVELENPSARIAPGQTPVKARDFRLDLSGVQLRAGLSLRF